jgi:hypothetical protein
MYRESRESTDALDLCDTLALLHAVTKRTIERADEFDVPKFREQTRALATNIRAALATSDSATLEREVAALAVLCDKGCSEDDSLRQIREAADALLKRGGDVWSVLLAKNEAMNKTDVMKVLARTLSLVRDVAGVHAAREVGLRLRAEIGPTRTIELAERAEDGPAEPAEAEVVDVEPNANDAPRVEAPDGNEVD